MRFRSFLFFLAALSGCLLSVLTARCVVPEKDYSTTLSSLLQELKQSYASALDSDSLLVKNPLHGEQLSEMLKAADEVTLKLYSQNSGFAFDVAFALEEVDRIRDSFTEQIRLSERYMTASRSGLRRYSLLDETLRDMYLKQPSDSLLPSDSLRQHLPAFVPPDEYDEKEKGLLDSCLHYTAALTELYRESVKVAEMDSLYCSETEQRLRQAFEYAQATYADTQKNRYVDGNVNVVHIFKNWGSFIDYLKEDLQTRYQTETGSWSGHDVLHYAALALALLLLSFLVAALVNHLIFRFVRREGVIPFKPILTAILAVLLFGLAMLLLNTDRNNPYWKMAYQLLSQFAWLTLAIFVSLLIRIDGSQARASRMLYVPTLLLAFVCILLRAVFLPVSVVPLIFPLALLVFIVWQSFVNIRCRAKVRRVDLRYMWVSVGVMTAAFILSLAGFSMIGVVLLTFWTFLLALLHTITTLSCLLRRYYDNSVIRHKARYHQENPNLPLDDKNAFIEVTWLYDLMQMVVVPIAAIMSFPLGLHLTARAYQLSLVGEDLLRRPIFPREGFEYVTPSNLLLILALFFVFRYLIYLIKALQRVARLRGVIEKNDRATTPFKESDVNLSLSNTLISLLGWLLYLVIVFAFLHMPTSAITAVTAGLAAGIGFALKDLINNFFYGIQLMAGRIRVGDKISCDGVRGIVKRVSYQTTQVEDEDGSLIAFTNTDLFSKKFRNLNSGRNYEFLKMPVSVRYGTDIEFARKVILEALEPLMTEDKYGRPVVDPSFPVDVRFDGFGDSSVNLIVALYSTVETHYTFPSRAKEAIYNAFYEHGIEIPFPQRDVYIKPVPGEPKQE